MGYFSNLALKIQEEKNGYDESYERKKLLERLEQFKVRRDYLLAFYQEGLDRSYIPDLELRYVLPENIKSIRGVNRAIDLVKEDLALHCGFILFEGEDLNRNIVTEIRKSLVVETGEYSGEIEGQIAFKANVDGSISLAA